MALFSECMPWCARKVLDTGRHFQRRDFSPTTWSFLGRKMVVGEGAAPPGTLIWRFPGFIKPRCTAGATPKAAESYKGIEVHVPYSPFPFRFIVSRGPNFKADHLPAVWSRVPYRTHLFPLERWVSRSPIFSFWQAVWFVSIPVWRLRRAAHQRSSQRVPAFQRSGNDLNLPMSSMMEKQGNDVDWGASPPRAFCATGLGARRPAKGSPPVPPGSVTRGCCQATNTTGRQPWFPQE